MIRPVVVSFVCSGDNGLGLNHSRWFEGNCCRLPNASGDCWQLREPRTQMGNWCEYQVTLDWTEADDTYGGTVFGENADRQERTGTLADKNGERGICVLSNWYFTERLSDEDFFGNWQLLSKIFSWFRIEIKINKRPKNLTCCVAEVDIVWRLLCKMTLILVSTFEFVCICNVYLWYKQDDLIFEILWNWYIYLNENRPWGVTWGLSTVNQEESQEQATDPASKLTSSTTSKLEGGTSSCPPSGSHNEALDHPSVDLWEALG